jgi:hypothetical protein
MQSVCGMILLLQGASVFVDNCLNSDNVGELYKKRFEFHRVKAE